MSRALQSHRPNTFTSEPENLAEILTDEERMLSRVGRRIIFNLRLVRLMDDDGFATYRSAVKPRLFQAAEATGVTYTPLDSRRGRLEFLNIAWNDAGALRIGRLAMEHRENIFAYLAHNAQQLTEPERAVVAPHQLGSQRLTRVEHYSGVRALVDNTTGEQLAEKLSFTVPEIPPATASLGWVGKTDDPTEFIAAAQEYLEAQPIEITYGPVQLMCRGKQLPDHEPGAQ